MRTIYLLAMCLWLNACATTQLFPPESTKDLTNDTAAITAWKDQASYTSGAHAPSTKVQLGGRITEVIPKPGVLSFSQKSSQWIVILAMVHRVLGGKRHSDSP